ncbi:MAG: hypothetical protein CMF62_03490 [Magnetococcales bacterium]|nr:hypothetical protein [Magnetococcales bacterium]|tara:strand:+ start:54237 stop:54857 length:621 start_codon:yes stop_codon:yes gene_type:complete
MIYDYLYKIVVLGESYTGKTAIIDRYIHNRVLKNYDMTIGVDLSVKMALDNGNKLKLHIFDLTGSKNFRGIMKNYINNAIGIILVYDTTNKISFYKILEWLKLIRDNKDGVFYGILVGNKNDDEQNRKIGYSEGLDLANLYGLEFIECNIYDKSSNEIFNKLVSKINKNVDYGKNNNGVKLNIYHEKYELLKEVEEVPEKRSYCCF